MGNPIFSCVIPVKGKRYYLDEERGSAGFKVGE